jgi:two-component system sensor histidine kinase CpxA
MKRGFSLSTRIFLLAFLNLFLLGFVFFVFARVEFRFDLRSFFLSPARDRILSVSRLIGLQLPAESQEQWSRTLAQYSAEYPAEFFLFGPGAKQLAGRAIQLPPEVFSIISREPPEHPPKGNTQPPLNRRDDHGAPVFLMQTQDPQGYWAVVHIPVWTDLSKGPEHGNLVWRIPSLLNSFYFDYKPWAAIIIAVIAVSVICWLPFIRNLTQSIGQLTRATSRIAAGQFEVAVTVDRKDEIGRLSESIRQMAKRLSEFVDGQRRFLGDIAHELCSPISRIQVAIGILEQRVAENEAEYVNDVREEVDHMSILVNELLSFSKAEIGASVHLAPVNVAETVARVLEREQPGAVEVRSDINQQLAVIAEPEYLFRSIANVVRNAIRYAGRSGPVLISAKNANGQVTITVADSGPGVPETELEQIFKPFYRPDQARQRGTGGTGLGLAIVKTCIEACGGTVRCRNLVPNGLAVDIKLTAR